MVLAYNSAFYGSYIVLKSEFDCMSELLYVGTKEEIPPGSSKVIVHEKHPIVVFNVEGTFYAVSNLCPHAAGPLDQGFVEDCKITCLWHDWTFELSPDDPPNDGLPRYRVHVDGEKISVEYPQVGGTPGKWE